MKFSDIIGQESIKKHLIENASQGRIPHAQLFVGPEGCGTLPMAIAYALHIINPNKTITSIQHPDLHFVFPTSTTDRVKSKPKSDDFLDSWYNLIPEAPYTSINDWYKFINIGNKQGLISVADSESIIQKLSLKSYEGGYKVLIIWMAEYMNNQCANKLLKILEEPPQKTAIILIAQNEKDILPTILSRCQIIRFNPLTYAEMAQALEERHFIDNTEPNEAIILEAQGNYNKLLKLLYDDGIDYPFGEWFIQWVRTAFLAAKKPQKLKDLIEWSEEIAAIGRENQKSFLNFCLEIFRQALMINYGIKQLAYISMPYHFSMEKFAPYVNEKNINDIYTEISNAIRHIERNGNPKLIFTDLAIKLTRYIHKK